MGCRAFGVGVPVAVFIVAFVVFVFSIDVRLGRSPRSPRAVGDGRQPVRRALFALLPILVMAAVVGDRSCSASAHILGGMNERWYRLDRFARANGMSFVPRIVGAGASRHDLRHRRLAARRRIVVRGDRPRFVEFGNYSYTTGSGKNRTTHQWGYVAVKLDVPLPNIVLDATSNNSLFGSNLPVTFDADQRLGLEGDFDQHFSLYCPEGYERDALYLFTPDIMARFIDNAAALDVEIVDDWLFLYGKREFSTLDPATWAWLFSVVAALLDKFAQWARWRDERLPADAAADDGCRRSGIRRHRRAGRRCRRRPLAALRPPPGSRCPAVVFSAACRGSRSSSWPRSWCSGCCRRPAVLGLPLPLNGRRRRARVRGPSSRSHTARRAACSSGSGTGSDAISRFV